MDRVDYQVEARKRVWWIVVWVCSVVTTFVITNYSWEIIFRPSMSMSADSFILFLSGVSFYHNKEFASLLKCHLNYPSSPHLFFQNYGNQPHLSPRLKILRYVIIPPLLSGISLVLSHIQAIILIIMTIHTSGRLCTVARVEESKLLLKMIHMWGTFLQGKNLDSIDFTFYMVIFVKPISQATITFVFNKSLASKKGASNSQLKLGKIVRIWSEMVLCTIFCVIVDRKRNNLEIPNRSIFWLAQQFCVLCLLQGSGIKGLEEFMIGELPKSLKNYASAMNGFVVDLIGNFLGILFSRLDKYYLRLMILSFLNMCYYYPISIIYKPIHYARSDMVERYHITINQ
ncbi:hypothetical protein ACOSP7_031359 [Xanthoceras sorbifolium]